MLKKPGQNVSFVEVLTSEESEDEESEPAKIFRRRLSSAIKVATINKNATVSVIVLKIL